MRVLQETIAVVWSAPDVAAQVDAQLRGWVHLLASVDEEAVESLGLGAVSPRHIGVPVGCMFLGAEQIELLGIGDEIEAVDALRYLARLIEAAEEGEADACPRT